MLYTKEQKNIFSEKARMLKILAFAGTGKTTTLKQIALINKKLSILYLAFNEGIVKEAKEKFPKNVDVKTANSFAYNGIGYKYSKKLKPYIPINVVLKTLFLNKKTSNIILAKKLISLIDKFCYSEYEKIEYSYDFLEKEDKKQYSKEKIVFYLKILWKKMESLDSNFPITHDFYLKLFQLQSKSTHYDIILFDESQDCNPCIKRLVLDYYYSSPLLKLYFVGDKHQNIFGFRGTENIFELIPETKSLPLTKSFRFGSNIANVANKILKIKNENNELIGNNLIKDNINKIDKNKNYTIICRTNSMVLGCALKQAKKGKKIFLLDNKSINNIQIFLDIDSLMKGNYKKIINPEIKKFKSLIKLEESAKLNNRSEILFAIKIVKNIKEDISLSFKNLKKQIVDNIDNSDVIITTAHKSKGLEFSQVILTNDFYDFFDKTGQLKQNINYEELNVIYVAVTRAINNLVLNESLNKLMDFNYEKEQKDIFNNSPY